jgi:hypothetical protein
MLIKKGIRTVEEYATLQEDLLEGSYETIIDGQKVKVKRYRSTEAASMDTLRILQEGYMRFSKALFIDETSVETSDSSSCSKVTVKLPLIIEE